MEKYVVVLERGDKMQTVVMCARDYEQSVRTDRANNAKMKYGSGSMWNVLNVMDYEAYQNMTDSKPFAKK